MAFPNLTPFNWEDAPSTNTKINAANLEDQQTHVYERLRDDVVQKVHEAAPSIEYWGASPSATAAANTTAINAALAASRLVVVPAGKSYDFSGTLNVADQTTFQIEGELHRTGAAGTAAIAMGDGASQRNNGGIKGKGRIFLRRTVDYAIDVNCWRNATFEGIIISDPIEAPIRIRNTNATSDCDSNKIINVRLMIEPTGSGWAPTDLQRPKRFILIDGSGTRIVSDNKVRNCEAIGGLYPAEVTGANGLGAWGAEVVDASRNVFEGCNWYGHNVRGTGANCMVFSGGYLLRSATKDVSGNIITNPYMEATVQAADGTTDPAYVFDVVRLSMAAGTDGRAMEWNQVNGAQFDSSAAAANRVRFRLINNEGATGTIRYNSWNSPRRPNLSDPGQILIGSNCDHNRVEVNTDAEVNGTGAPFWTNNSGGATNRLVSRTGSAASVT